MKQLTRGWAVLALTVSVVGPANAAVDVSPAPIHIVPDGGDGAMAPEPEPGVQTASLSAPTGAEIADLAPQPPGPSVAIARSIVDAAGAFDSYIRSASRIDPNFTDGQAVARAVSIGSAYEPRQLQAGAVAYAALVALQDPLFVEVVTDAGERPSGRAFAENLLNDPSLVLEAPAARTEAVRVAAALGQAGARLLASGQAVKQAAYDIQHQAWSKAPIAGPETQLAVIKSQSSHAYALTPKDTSRLMSTIAAWRTVGGTGGGGYTSTPIVTRGLALAALAVLGQAGEDQADRLAPLLTDADSAQCVKMAKLNLYQCLAVAGPHYEDAFCLGRHAMMETGQCIVAAAGSTGAELAPTSRSELAQAQSSVMVPIALAAGEQSERESVFGPPAR